MLHKLIQIDDSTHNQPAAAIVPVLRSGHADSGWVRKRASARVFSDFEAKPRKGRAVVHLIAVGATPHYPCNKNADGYYDHEGRVVRFENGGTYTIKRGLKETHPTFCTNAKVYREHFTERGAPSFGEVLRSAFNDVMQRVELLVDVDSNALATELQNLASGKEQGWSIGCAVPYDVCSVCGTQRRKRTDTCEHLSNHLGMALDSGGVVHAINDKMRFDDISVVSDKADYIAYGLLKVARAEGSIVGGAELYSMLRGDPDADRPPLSKLAVVLGKLATLEKTIPAELDLSSPITQSAVLSSLEDAGVDPDELSKKLASNGVPATRFLAELAKYQVVLPARDFLRILSGDASQSATTDAIARLVDDVLPSAFTRTHINNQVPEDIQAAFEPGGTAVPLPPCIKKIVSNLVSRLSLVHADQPTRVRITVIRKGMPMRKSAMVTPTDPAIESLAQAYTLYKAAACVNNNDSALTQRVVLSHYIQ